MQNVDKKLLDILVCPLTKGPLHYDAVKQELISEKAKLAYPIRDGIPIMLVEEARKLDVSPRYQNDVRTACAESGLSHVCRASGSS